jgi:SAM-dependent methyltransferase
LVHVAESDDQYNAIGSAYERAKFTPTGLAEQATFLSALPALPGKSVLDVACGTGFYPRKFAAAGAATVVGVDSSREMVAYARIMETREPRGIVYHQYDAADLPALGRFEVVTAAWLLCYADDVTTLDRMVGNLRGNLAPGGTLAVMVPNPDADWNVLPDDYGRYGCQVVRTGELTFRMPVSVRVLDDPPFAFDSYFWPSGAFDDALRRAGLTEVTRQPTIVPDDEHGPEFWAALRRSPNFAVFTAKYGG